MADPHTRRGEPEPPSSPAERRAPVEPAARLRRRRPTWLEVVVVLGAPFVAWLVAASGYTIVVAEPMQDIAILLLWSVAEEVVFRGGIQTMLAKRWRREPPTPPRLGVSKANAVTSVLFCAAHLWRLPPLAAFGLMPISLLLGASLERSGRLRVPIALHAYFNLLLYAASAWSMSALA